MARKTNSGPANTVAEAAQHLEAADGDNLAVSEAQSQLEGMLGDEEPEELAAEETDEAEFEADDEPEEEDAAEDEDEEDDEAEDGDDEEDDSEEDDEEAEEPTYTVKVDGEEVEVTQSELLAGYSRDADYRRKTQALAEERKSVEAELEQLRQERAQYAQMLPALQQQLQSAGEKEPDWDRLYNEDPVEWVRQRELWRERQEKLQAVQAEQQRLQQTQTQEQQKALQQQLKQEQEELAKKLPEIVDPEKGQQVRQRIAEYGRQVGFRDEELNNVYDHRAIVVLDKARRYDELMAKKQNLRPKPSKKAPRTAAPGPSSSPSEQKRARKGKRYERFVKSGGSVNDAASALESLL